MSLMLMNQQNAASALAAPSAGDKGSAGGPADKLSTVLKLIKVRWGWKGVA